jgi:putative oxidoreductase
LLLTPDSVPLLTEAASDATAKIVNVVLWVLQIAAAGMFLMIGFLKLSGNAQLVGLCEVIGLGQWFRYLTGTLEVAGAFLLLIPRTSGLGALMLAGVMVGAIVTHVFIGGGSPLTAIILLVVTGVVAWGRRQRTMKLLDSSLGQCRPRGATTRGRFTAG